MKNCLLTFLFLVGVCHSDPVLRGHDVVAYFDIVADDSGAWETSNGIDGVERFKYIFEYGQCGLSAEFWFSSAANRDRFIDDPWAFAPKVGGFCTWGIGRELEPEWPWDFDHVGPPGGPSDGWRIYNGALYINYQSSVRSLFFGGGQGYSIEQNIEAAEERWIGWYGSLEDGPFNWACVDNPNCVHDEQNLPEDAIECFQELVTTSTSTSTSPSDNDAPSSGDCEEISGEWENKRLVGRFATTSSASCCEECYLDDDCTKWQWRDQEDGCYLLSDGDAEESSTRSRWVRGERPSSIDTGRDEGEGGCASNEWECDNGECIPIDYACDNYNDCADRSDETNCGGSSQERDIAGSCTFEFLNSDLGEFYVDIEINADQTKVKFVLTVRLEDLDSWVGIGFSDDGTMWSKFNSGIDGTDAVIRELDFVREFNIESYSQDDIQPESASRQDLEDTSVTESNGYIIIEFTKPVVSPSNSDDDLSFFGAQYIVWAYGFPGDEQLAYHANRGLNSVSLGDCLEGCGLELICEDDSKLLSRDDSYFEYNNIENERMEKIEQRVNEIDEKLLVIQNGINKLLEEHNS